MKGWPTFYFSIIQAMLSSLVQQKCKKNFFFFPVIPSLSPLFFFCELYATWTGEKAAKTINFCFIMQICFMLKLCYAQSVFHICTTFCVTRFFLIEVYIFYSLCLQFICFPVVVLGTHWISRQDCFLSTSQSLQINPNTTEISEFQRQGLDECASSVLLLQLLQLHRNIFPIRVSIQKGLKLHFELTLRIVSTERCRVICVLQHVNKMHQALNLNGSSTH